MTIVRGWVVLALAACTGPSDETLITELRLVAMAADPPAVAPGGAFELTVTVADPLAEGGQLLVWSCLPPGAEVPDPGAASPPPTSARGLGHGCVRHLVALGPEQVTFAAVAVAPVPIWALACAPRRCGDLAEATEAQLRDPVSWLRQLPISGVSGGFRTAPLVPSDGESPTNPALLEAPLEPVVAEPELGVPLAFVAPGARSAYGYTTAGGFSAPRYDVSSTGEVTLTWFAPAEPAAATAPARLYVVLEDDLGGVTVWIGDAG